MYMYMYMYMYLQITVLFSFAGSSMEASPQRSVLMTFTSVQLVRSCVTGEACASTEALVIVTLETLEVRNALHSLVLKFFIFLFTFRFLPPDCRGNVKQFNRQVRRTGVCIETEVVVDFRCCHLGDVRCC